MPSVTDLYKECNRRMDPKNRRDSRQMTKDFCINFFKNIQYRHNVKIYLFKHKWRIFGARFRRKICKTVHSVEYRPS